MKKNLIVTCSAVLAISMLAGCGNVADKSKSNTYPEAAKVLYEVKTTQFFADEAIGDEDVEKILSAGVNAPSAMNTQPWHFTAVTDKEINEKLANAMSSMKPPAGAMPGKGNMPPKDFPGKPEGMPEGKPDVRPEGMPEGRPEGMPEMKEGEKPDFAKMAKKAGLGDAPLTVVVSCREGSDLDAGLAVQNMAAEAQLLGYGTKIMTAPTMALNTDEYKALLNVPEGQKIAAVLIVGKAASVEENPDAVSSATTRNDFSDVVTIIQ